MAKRIQRQEVGNRMNLNRYLTGEEWIRPWGSRKKNMALCQRRDGSKAEKKNEMQPQGAQRHRTVKIAVVRGRHKRSPPPIGKLIGSDCFL